MKIKFKNSKGQFSFVKVSDLAFYTDHTVEGVCYVELEDNRVQNIDTGNKKVEWSEFVEDLTEEQWQGVVDWGSYLNTYKNYITNDNHKSNQCSSATESGKSLMESLEVYLENPVPQPEIYYDPEIPMDSIHNGFYDQSWVDTYEEAEKKVGNWLLIKYL